MELRIEGLSKIYGNGVKALDHVSLHIDPLSTLVDRIPADNLKTVTMQQVGPIFGKIAFGASFPP